VVFNYNEKNNGDNVGRFSRLGGRSGQRGQGLVQKMNVQKHTFVDTLFALSRKRVLFSL